MATLTEETNMTQAVPATPDCGNAKAHSGPIARLLSQVSRAAEVHAAHKLSKCDWRRLSI